MISKHSAHSASLPVGFRSWLWHYTCLLLLTSMLWHRQAIFESKGDKLFPLLNAGFEHKVSDTYSPADWIPADKPTELSRIKLKNLNSTGGPYDQQAFSPLDLTASWLSQLALALYMFVVVNFDALAQTSDIRIERRQVVSSTECRILTQGLRHLFASRLYACWQTYWAIKDQDKTWTRQPVPMISKHSARSTSPPVGFRTWLWRYTCLLLLISMLWHRQAISKSKRNKLFPLLNAGFEPKVFDTNSPADWMPADKSTELSRIKLKNLNSTARPNDQQTFSPLDLTARWFSHLALAIYMFLVVNFAALAQTSDIRIARTEIVFLCWMHDSNPRSQTPIRQWTECLLTNGLSYLGSS